MKVAIAYKDSDLCKNVFYIGDSNLKGEIEEPIPTEEQFESIKKKCFEEASKN